MPILLRVPLTAIRDVAAHELDDKRLASLSRSREGFVAAVNSGSDPIALDASGAPPFGKAKLDITDGRHRIYLARQFGTDAVPAHVFVAESRVKLAVNVAASRQCGDWWRTHDDPPGHAALQAYASTLFPGTADISIEEYNVERESGRVRVQIKVGCTLTYAAREDLAVLGLGLNGSAGPS